jgi:hypothetical protein
MVGFYRNAMSAMNSFFPQFSEMMLIAANDAASQGMHGWRAPFQVILNVQSGGSKETPPNHKAV